METFYKGQSDKSDDDSDHVDAKVTEIQQRIEAQIKM